MSHCKVQGCMANTDGPYAGLPACMQGFGGTPELAAATFKDCMFKADQPDLPVRLVHNADCMRDLDTDYNQSEPLLREAAFALERMKERCAAVCDALGDAEFARLMKRNGNAGIATLAQRHYMACAAAIRNLK